MLQQVLDSFNVLYMIYPKEFGEKAGKDYELFFLIAVHYFFSDNASL